MATFEKRKRRGKDVFRAVVRLAGYPPQRAVFAKKREAMAWAARVESEIREQRYFLHETAKRHSIAEMIDRYIETVLFKKSKKKRYIEQQHKQLMWWKKQLGDSTIFNVNTSVIVEVRDKLSINRSHATVNRYMAVLSHVYTIAVKEWRWSQENPIQKISKYKEPRGRLRFLSKQELERLMAVLAKHPNEMATLIVLMAISTGARKSEITSLKWEDFDAERKMIMVQESKNDDRRQLPLRGKCWQWFEAYAKHKAKRGFVFPSRNKRQPFRIDSAWQEIKRAARLRDFRFHDLRHTAASYMAMHGVPLITISELLGHKSLNMVKRYAHLSEGHVADAVEKMNEEMFNHD